MEVSHIMLPLCQDHLRPVKSRCRKIRKNNCQKHQTISKKRIFFHKNTISVLFPNICSFAKNYYLLYTISIRRGSAVIRPYSPSIQANIRNPLRYVALHQITAPQFIRRSLHSSWYKQVPTHCLLLFATPQGTYLIWLKKGICIQN